MITSSWYRRNEGSMPVNKRLVVALTAYAVLSAAGALLLDGKVRQAFLLMMLAFVAKTLIAWKAGW